MELLNKYSKEVERKNSERSTSKDKTSRITHKDILQSLYVVDLAKLPDVPSSGRETPSSVSSYHDKKPAPSITSSVKSFSTDRSYLSKTHQRESKRRIMRIIGNPSFTDEESCSLGYHLRRRDKRYSYSTLDGSVINKPIQKTIQKAKSYLACGAEAQRSRKNLQGGDAYLNNLPLNLKECQTSAQIDQLYKLNSKRSFNNQLMGKTRSLSQAGPQSMKESQLNNNRKSPKDDVYYQSSKNLEMRGKQLKNLLKKPQRPETQLRSELNQPRFAQRYNSSPDWNLLEDEWKHSPLKTGSVHDQNYNANELLNKKGMFTNPSQARAFLSQGELKSYNQTKDHRYLSELNYTNAKKEMLLHSRSLDRRCQSIMYPQNQQQEKMEISFSNETNDFNENSSEIKPTLNTSSKRLHSDSQLICGTSPSSKTDESKDIRFMSEKYIGQKMYDSGNISLQNVGELKNCDSKIDQDLHSAIIKPERSSSSDIQKSSEEKENISNQNINSRTISMKKSRKPQKTQLNININVKPICCSHQNENLFNVGSSGSVKNWMIDCNPDNNLASYSGLQLLPLPSRQNNETCENMKSTGLVNSSSFVNSNNSSLNSIPLSSPLPSEQNNEICENIKSTGLINSNNSSLNSIPLPSRQNNEICENIKSTGLVNSNSIVNSNNSSLNSINFNSVGCGDLNLNNFKSNNKNIAEHSLTAIPNRYQENKLSQFVLNNNQANNVSNNYYKNGINLNNQHFCQRSQPLTQPAFTEFNIAPHQNQSNYTTMNSSLNTNTQEKCFMKDNIQFKQPNNEMLSSSQPSPKGSCECVKNNNIPINKNQNNHSHLPKNTTMNVYTTMNNSSNQNTQETSFIKDNQMKQPINEMHSPGQLPTKGPHEYIKTDNIETNTNQNNHLSPPKQSSKLKLNSSSTNIKHKSNTCLVPVKQNENSNNKLMLIPSNSNDNEQESKESTVMSLTVPPQIKIIYNSNVSGETKVFETCNGVLQQSQQQQSNNGAYHAMMPVDSNVQQTVKLQDEQNQTVTVINIQTVSDSRFNKESGTTNDSLSKSNSKSDVNNSNNNNKNIAVVKTKTPPLNVTNKASLKNVNNGTQDNTRKEPPITSTLAHKTSSFTKMNSQQPQQMVNQEQLRLQQKPNQENLWLQQQKMNQKSNQEQIWQQQPQILNQDQMLSQQKLNQGGKQNMMNQDNRPQGPCPPQPNPPHCQHYIQKSFQDQLRKLEQQNLNQDQQQNPPRPQRMHFPHPIYHQNLNQEHGPRCSKSQLYQQQTQSQRRQFNCPNNHCNTTPQYSPFGINYNATGNGAGINSNTPLPFFNTQFMTATGKPQELCNNNNNTNSRQQQQINQDQGDSNTRNNQQRSQPNKCTIMCKYLIKLENVILLINVLYNISSK